MQWADTATLDLVLYLARSLAERPAPVLLLLNLRLGTDSFTDVQSTWLMALKRTRIALTALVLAAFKKEETQRFVQALAWAEQPFEGGTTAQPVDAPRIRHQSSPATITHLPDRVLRVYVSSAGL